MRRAQQYVQLTQLLRGLLPSPLADHTRVGDLSSPKLTLVVGSPVWAAKLRYLTPSLLTSLQALPPFRTVTEISIKITALHNEVQHPRKEAVRPRMSLASADTIRHMAESITDPNLRAALLRLSRHGV